MRVLEGRGRCAPLRRSLEGGNLVITHVLAAVPERKNVRYLVQPPKAAVQIVERIVVGDDNADRTVAALVRDGERSPRNAAHPRRLDRIAEGGEDADINLAVGRHRRWHAPAW